jgi:RNA polymerase sigma factor (sigma-70 family)
MPRLAEMKDVFRHLCRTKNCRLYSLLDDGDLLDRFLADREEIAFEELVTRHGPMVRAVCRRVLGASADADDAFQATFLVLIRRAHSIRRTDLLANWLCAVAYRTARQALRRRYRLERREQPAEYLPEQSRPDDPPRDWLPLFDAALQRLPSKYREPMVLCELQGLPRPEAARKLGLNEGTLSSRLGRARDLMRQRLGRHGFPLAIGTALAPAVVPEALTASTAAAAITISSASVSAIVLTEGVLAAMFASKLKAGATCATVLLFGVVAGLQFTGPTSLAGGPPDKDGPVAKEATKEKAARPNPTSPLGPDPKPSQLAAEYQPFQGEWIVTAATSSTGGTGPEAVGVDENWKFLGTTLTTGGEAKDDSFEKFVLDTGMKPARIDFTLTQFTQDASGKLVRTAYQGIYKFEPDGALVICYRLKVDDVLRPTRFATARNSGATLIALRRPEPKRETPISIEYAFPIMQPDRAFEVPTVDRKTAQSAPKNTDLAQVIGAWELTDVDGMTPEVARQKLNRDRLPPLDAGSSALRRWELLRHLYLLPGSAPITLTPEARGSMCLANFELDGTKSPKWITLHAMIQQPTDDPVSRDAFKDVRLSGIYKLDGEKLVMCLPEGEVSPLLWPTEFKGDGEGGLYVLTYKRSTKDWKPVMPPMSVPASNATSPVPASTIPPQGPQGPPPIAGNDPLIPPTVREASPSAGPPTDSSPTIPPGIAPSINVPQPSDSDARPPARALDRLQGEWLMTQTNGKPIDLAMPDAFAGATMEILKDRILFGTGIHGRVQVDESKSPRQMVIEIRKDGVEVRRCIFRLDGDVLTMAFYDKPGKLIPADFEPDPDNGVSVHVYERLKDVQPPRAEKAGTYQQRPKTARPPERDLQKEVDQLREQLKRLQNKLNQPLPQP